MLKLPYITGYLAAGVLAGGSVLNLLSFGTYKELQFVNSFALGIIAFIAGSELYLRELRKQIKTIALVSLGIIATMMLLGTITIYELSGLIDFTKILAPQSQFAVALLGATVLLALSPPSTIAVIKEVRAKGLFTRTILSVTVAIDVAIVFCFAISVNFVEPLLDASKSFDARFLLLLILDLVLAIGLGWFIGIVLAVVLGSKQLPISKMVMITLLGAGIFFGAKYIKALTEQTAFEIHIEPLLTAMIAGIYVANRTHYRNQFEELLSEISPSIYVAFFFLTGLGLDLKLLISMLPYAGAIFLIRLLSIYIGSYLGSQLAKAPEAFRRNAWMGFITQAGIALGLAAEVSTHFKELGTAFQNLIVSVILLNEIFGPLFLKYVLRKVGDASDSEEIPVLAQRRAILFGIDGQSLALARQLASENWQVLMLDTDEKHVELITGKSMHPNIEARHIGVISHKSLSKCMEKPTHVFVALKGDDHENLRACRFISDRAEIRLIVRLNHLGLASDFKELNAFVLDQASAMVNLLAQAVIAPQSTALLLHRDETRAVRQIKVANTDLDGQLVRDLRLPADVLLLDILRRGETIVPNGFTRIKTNDEITVIGTTEDVNDVEMRLSA